MFTKCLLYVEGALYALPHSFSCTHRIYPIGTSIASILQMRHREENKLAQIYSVNNEVRIGTLNASL